MGGVWITGFGCICALGKDARTTMDGVVAGTRPQTRADIFPHVSADRPVCAVPADWLPAAPDAVSWRAHTAGDTVRLLRHAADEALDSARIAPGDMPASRTGHCIGTTAGCSLHILSDYIAMFTEARRHFFPSIDAFFSNSPALNASGWTGSGGGPAITISNACTSGADAIGQGMRLIASGVCDVVLAGGADALNDVPYIGFSRLSVFSRELCLPFDRRRNGLNLGEGAAVLVLESPEHARKRGAAPRAVLSGYGAASDAHHISSPHPEGKGLRAAIAKALADSGLAITDLGFVNAHGTGTIENDKIEGAVYSTWPGTPPVWASKGSTGHCLGAAGAVEAVLSVLALEAGSVPASPGCEMPEEAMEPLITRSPVSIDKRHAMSVSLGFGGSNAALVFSLPDTI